MPLGNLMTRYLRKSIMELRRLVHYKLGIKKLDDEHEAHAKLIQELFNLVSNNADVTKHLSKLEYSMLSHFANEEAYLESINYPFLKEHKLQHAALTKHFYKATNML